MYHGPEGPYQGATHMLEYTLLIAGEEHEFFPGQQIESVVAVDRHGCVYRFDAAIIDSCGGGKYTAKACGSPVPHRIHGVIA